jgi:hypothetical protein
MGGAREAGDAARVERSRRARGCRAHRDRVGV